MHSVVSYMLVAGAGFFLAYVLSRPPELRRLRLAQLIFLPAAFVAALWALPEPSDGAGIGGLGSFVMFLGILGFIIILITPNLAHLFGAAFSNFLDPLDWIPAEEDIALRPVQKWIDKDRYQDAFAELEGLLKTHKPTFDALHLKAKLQNHFQRHDETIATLLRMLPLSSTTAQQLVVMDLLAALDDHRQSSPRAPLPGPCRVRIAHELVLFHPGAKDRSVHREIPSGEYHVEEMLIAGQHWLVLAGEPWGNAVDCWDAVKETVPAATSAKTGFLYHVARIQQRFAFALTGKPWRQAKADSRVLHLEASGHIRAGDWATALPLLLKAAAEDPDNYEIAYHLVQAARRVRRAAEAREILAKVLVQSRWTEDQEAMLKQATF